MGQSAVTLVFDPTGAVLVLRRGPTDPWKPGHWNFPGGKVDPGERVQEGARRELAEESGISLPAESLNWAFSFREGPRAVHLFWVKLNWRPEVTMPDGEHDRFLWVPNLYSIPQPSIHSVRYVVNQLTRHHGGGWNLAPLDPDYRPPPRSFVPSGWSW